MRSAAHAEWAEVEAEASAYVELHRRERDAAGRALVVGNGRAPVRKITLAAGTVEVGAPRVNDRRRDAEGRRQRFTNDLRDEEAGVVEILRDRVIDQVRVHLVDVVLEREQISRAQRLICRGI